MDKIKALKELLVSAEADAEKFYNKGNSNVNNMIM